MLEEALKVFGFTNICSLEDLDTTYKKLIRKNYEENFPYNKEAGTMNVRLYEWSYQIILPFAIGKDLELKSASYYDLATLKILIFLFFLACSIHVREAPSLPIPGVVTTILYCGNVLIPTLVGTGITLG